MADDLPVKIPLSLYIDTLKSTVVENSSELSIKIKSLWMFLV